MFWEEYVKNIYMFFFCAAGTEHRDALGLQLVYSLLYIEMMRFSSTYKIHTYDIISMFYE